MPANTDAFRTDTDSCSPAPVSPLPANIKAILKGEAQPAHLEETRAVLQELAHRKSGKLPPEVLVEQVLAVTTDTDWPTRRAALDALVRRLGFAARDDLAIVARPTDNRVLGRYQLARRIDPEGGRKTVARPYITELRGVRPLLGSCDCPDFTRGSLGLCKHLLVVASAVLSTPSRVQAALREQNGQDKDRTTLCWNPVREWTGVGDRLMGLRLEGNRGPKADCTASSDWLGDGRPNPSKLDQLESRASWLRTLLNRVDRDSMIAEPGARAVVVAELETAERRLSAEREVDAILPHVESLQRKLFAYQQEGVRRFLQVRRLLLADDMGLGKTTEAIAACHAIHQAGAVKRGLLIVPAALKPQWVREWEATTDRVHVVPVEGRPEERAQLYRSTKDGFLMIGYEQLLRDLPHVHQFAPEIVVLDEAQRIKNWATKSSAYVMTLKPDWRLVLTGTPMENRLDELATILDWVDDVALTPKWRLNPWHTSWHSDAARGRSGARNLDTLRQRVAPCLLRRVRKEVLGQLPPRTDQRVPVEMTDLQRETHDSFHLPIAQLIRISAQRPLRQEQFLRLMSLLTQQRIASNGMAQFAFDEFWPTYSRLRPEESVLSAMSSPKLIEFKRLLGDLVLEQERNVVVFSQWRNMLRLAEWATRDMLEQYGLRAVFFTGAEKQHVRTRNIVDFHDDRSARVMFLTDAGGVGLNLQRAASACINLELPWNPAVLEQRIGRIYRLGQQEPVSVFNLVTEQSIESRIADLVGNKHALFKGLFDGDSDEIRFDGASGFLDQVRRIIEPVVVPELTALPLDQAEESESAATDLATEQAADPAESDSRERETGSTEQATIEPEHAATSADGTPTITASATDESAERTAGEVSIVSLFRGVKVARTADGALRLDADPVAANQLASLLEGLAGLLRSAGGQSG
jgi:hypothetical protein